MKKSYTFHIILFITALLLAACETNNATRIADNNAPILSGVGDMPKALITVQFSPTPDPANFTPTAFATEALPTETPEPAEPTITPTPYVGVFVGTQVNGTPISNNSIPLGITPFVGNQGNVSGVIFPTMGAGTTLNCTMPVASQFNTVYLQNPSIAQQLGCPVNGGQSLTLVYQPFERGKMFWRDTRQIFIMQADGTLITIQDVWNEGMPADDPAFAAPAGVLQPVRGFGLVWRSNEPVRGALGWATQSENYLPSYWQDFQNGTAMFMGESGFIYVLMGGRYSGPFSG